MFNTCINAEVFCDICTCYEGTVFVCGLNNNHFHCHAWSALHFEATYNSATFRAQWF